MLSICLAATVVFTGHLLLVEPKSADKTALVIGPTGMDHAPTLLIESASVESLDLANTGLKLHQAWTPLGTSAYALPLSGGWELAFEADSETMPKFRRTAGTVKQKPAKADWPFLDYVPHLARMSERYTVLPEYVVPIGRMQRAQWANVGVRFWFDGATEVYGAEPATEFAADQWVCDDPRNVKCVWQLGDKKEQGLSDRFQVDFPRVTWLRLSDKQGNLRGRLKITSAGRLWLVGQVRFVTLSDPNAPLEHVRHYFHFIKDAAVRSSTIKRFLTSAGPVFCPPGVAEY